MAFPRARVGSRSLPFLVAFAGIALVGWTLIRGEVAAALGATLLTGLAVLAQKAPSRERLFERTTDAGHQESGNGLLASLPDPVILVDERSVVLDANAAAQNVAPGLRVGFPLSFALRSPQALEAIPRVIKTRQGTKVEIGGRIATEPTYAVTLSPLVADGGQEKGAAVLTFLNLTEQRRSERMRADFVANVSHELRTPLASILGFVETLQGPARNDRPAQEKFLEIMRGQANRMKGLIDDLLALSRVEMRAHVPPSGSVDVSTTVAHMVEIMAPLARERGVTIALDVPDAPLMAVADRDELLRVVENLVANAIKYGGNGGKIEVGAWPGEGDRSVELAVRDYGPGIAPEHLPRLTERFYRVDVAESRAQGGTGLGLAIVKHIVTRHRGRLKIESEPGRGAVFKVRLPRAEAGPPA